MAPPAARNAPEPLPLERPVELARRPLEVASEGGVSLPLCAESAPAACSALGAAFSGGLVALHRPSPYFAAGGVLSSRFSGGHVDGIEVEQRALALGARLRVYLLEQGELDPYLELGFGLAEVQNRVSGRVVNAELTPCGEVGGGADVLLGQRLRVGVGVSLSDVFMRGLGAERRAGAVFRLSLAFGEPL